MLQLDLLSVFDKESTPPTFPTTELRYRLNTSFFAKPTATLLENPLTKYTHGQPPTAFTRCNLLSKSVFFFLDLPRFHSETSDSEVIKRAIRAALGIGTAKMQRIRYSQVIAPKGRRWFAALDLKLRRLRSILFKEVAV